MPQSDRLHQAVAVRGTVTRPVVDVLGPKTARAVIAIAAVGERAHVFPASLASERHVFGMSADGPLLQVEGASTCRRRVPFALARTWALGLDGRGTQFTANR